MSEPIIPEIEDISVQDIAANPGAPPKNDYSLETLMFLINKQRVVNIETQTRNEFKELKQRQSQVRFLHQFLKAVNVATDAKGGFDCTNNADLQKILEQAKEMGVDLEQGKLVYSRDERERLIDNVRMSIDDLNVQNEMQLQSITRLTNERYESFQLARSIMKPLHDDKISKARSISGR